MSNLTLAEAEHAQAVCQKLSIKRDLYELFKQQSDLIKGVFTINATGSLGDDPFPDGYEYYLEERLKELAKKHSLYTYFEFTPDTTNIYLSREPMTEDNFKQVGCEVV